MSLLPPREIMVRAFQASETAFEGLFWTGVTSTGIVCRVGCPARKPSPERLAFFARISEAIAAGFRPCLRCRPLEPVGRVPDWIQPWLRGWESGVEGRRRGRPGARERRWFESHWGLTVAEYVRLRRLSVGAAALGAGRTLDDAGAEAGYESLSGFREAFVREFRGTPGGLRGVDHGWVGWLESPLGPMMAVSREDRLVALQFAVPGRVRELRARLERELGCRLVPGEDGVLAALRREVAEYFGGTRRAFGVEVAMMGTPFQRRVWEALRGIPYGGTISYGELAERVGVPGGSRAVGSANGRNRLVLVIPCHRVVNAGGALGGYSAALWRKRYLLRLESERVDRAAV